MPVINFLIKPASSNCNMQCTYCFYRLEAENRSTASHGMMSEDTLELIVKKGLKYADGICSFAFQGGEPTLVGLPFFYKLIYFERKYNRKNIKIKNSIQTNGILINETWCRFLHENNFLVGLSIDGPKDIHNLHRVDTGGNGTHNRVMKAAALFNRYQVEYNILSVVTAASSNSADKIYNFYKKNGFHYLQFINCLDPADKPQGRFPYSLGPENLEIFLKRLFDRWYEDFIHSDYVSIRYFDNLVYMLKGHRPEACNMSGVCQSSCVVEADGSVYPCDFYALDQWKLGNIKNDSIGDMLTGEASKRFIETSLNKQDSCKRCKWYQLCRGGCRRECEPLRENNERVNYYCSAYKHFFDYAYDRLCLMAAMA